jgi:hypothetical protein
MARCPTPRRPQGSVRELVIAYVVARFVVQLEAVDWRGAVQLGVWLWFGFVFNCNPSQGVTGPVASISSWVDLYRSGERI